MVPAPDGGDDPEHHGRTRTESAVMALPAPMTANTLKPIASRTVSDISNRVSGG
jgi:hypothetical protein